MPVFLSITPTSPANNNEPTITGTGSAGATITIFDSSGCIGNEVTETVVPDGGSFSAKVNVNDNTTTVFSAYSTRDGKISACTSLTLTYMEDSTLPAVPSITASTPASPSAQTDIVLSGMSEANSKVSIYKTTDCSGSAVIVATAGSDGNFSAAVTANPNTTTSFSAKAADFSGNTSACSSKLDYSALPAVPVLLASNPASPSNNNDPVITGTALANSTIKIYDSAGCIGNKIGEGTVGTDGSFSIATHFDDNTVTTVSASVTIAGLTSACTTDNLVYTEDSTPPAAPTLSGTTPSSPSNATSISAAGSAEAASTVTLYRSADCSSPSIGTSTATGGNFSFTSITIDANATTPLSVNTRDAAGNVSACSTGINFVNDSTAPTVLSFASLTASPANNNAPSLQAQTEAGATVKVYITSNCSGSPVGTASAADTNAFSVPLTIGDDQTVSLYATSTDAVGNVTSCTSTGLSYTEDSTAPSVPTGLAFSPVSPSNNQTPTMSGSAESGSTVKVFKSAACTGSPIKTVSSTGTFSTDVGADANNLTSFFANATDVAGNVSGCTSAIVFQHDNVPPTTPANIVVTPMPPPGGQNVNSPVITGTTDALTTVKLYHTSNCTGVVDVSGTSDSSGAIQLTATVADNATPFPFTVQAVDAAGNTSCSTATAPFIENTPVLKGTVSYSGSKTGRIYISIAYANSGDNALVGSSIPALGSYAVRGLGLPGNYSVRYWMDALGTGTFNASVDPYFETSSIAINGTTTSDVTLVDPTPGALTAPSINAIFTGSGGMAAVLWDRLKDNNGRDLADHYEVFASTSAIDPNAPGSPVATVGSSDVAFLSNLTNTTFHFRVRGVRAGVAGPISNESTAVMGSPASGATVTGSVNFSGTTPSSGTLYVILFSQSSGAYGAAIHTALSSPQAFSIPGVANGTYQLLAFVDINDNGWLDAADMGVFDASGPKIAEVNSGAPVTLAPIAIPTQSAVAAVQTNTFLSESNPLNYSLQFIVQANGKLPVTATVTDGVQMSPPIDLGFDQSNFGPPTLKATWTAWRKPVVGDSYTISVTYSDGSTATFNPTVTGILAVPTATFPIGNNNGTTTAFPFTWTAPSPAPTSYIYSFSMWPNNGGGDLWSIETLSSNVTSIIFNQDNRASNDPLVAGNQYNWRIQARDLFGNSSTHMVSFKAQN